MKMKEKSHMQTLRRKRKRTTRQIRRPRTQRLGEQLLARVGVAGCARARARRACYRAHRCKPTAAVVDVLLGLDGFWGVMRDGFRCWVGAGVGVDAAEGIEG